MKRLECLDGLRGLLAVYVMFSHLAPFAVLPPWIQKVGSHGGAAMDVFFVLSGLVITQSLYRAGGRAAPFLFARAARVYPVFLLVFAMAVLIQGTSCGFDKMPWLGADNAARMICFFTWPPVWPIQILAHLTMTHGLFPNGVLSDVWVSLLGSAWSLSTEWQFYILMLVGFGQPNNLRNLLLLVAAGGVVWVWLVPEAMQFSRAFLGNEAHFFALGVASLAVVQGRRGATSAYAGTLVVTLAICATQENIGKMLPPLVWTGFLTIQVRPDTIGLRLAADFLRGRTMQYLGAISYCVYLVNEPVQKLLANGLGGVADGNWMIFTVCWIPAGLLLPVVVAGRLHTHIEQPAMRWSRRMTQAWFP